MEVLGRNFREERVKNGMKSGDSGGPLGVSI